jgi:hypothetical protein
MNIIEMARQAGLDWARGWTLEDGEPNQFEAFAELVRADEREACAKLCETTAPSQINGYECADAIRARGTT